MDQNINYNKLFTDVSLQKFLERYLDIKIYSHYVTIATKCICLSQHLDLQLSVYYEK